MNRLILYVASPYRGNLVYNIRRTREASAAIWRMGHVALCPHANTAHFDTFFPDIPDEAYLSSDLLLLERCDGLVLVPGWQQSSGAKAERDHAVKLRLP